MYKALNGWTKQKIIAHIQANFKGQAMEHGTCKYRTSDGKKCGVGLFIPDGHSAFQSEGKIAETLIEMYPDLLNVLPLDAEGMSALQTAHDCTDPDYVLDEMIELIETNVVDAD